MSKANLTTFISWP